MAYSSDIKLPLGQEPQAGEDAGKIWPDLLDIYNSIHLLAQYTDRLVKGQTSGDSSQKPWESVPFRYWFYELVQEKVKTGNIVTPYLDHQSGQRYYKLGVHAWPVTGNYYESSGGSNGFIGVALQDAEPGDLCKIGIGPAILNISGVELGDWLWTPLQNANENGQFVQLVRGQIYNVKIPLGACIGAAVAKDAAMIFPMVDYWTTDGANYIAPPDQGNGGSGL